MKLRGSNVASPTNSTKRGATRQLARARRMNARIAAGDLSPNPCSS
jgi:hypothetical protein